MEIKDILHESPS